MINMENNRFTFDYGLYEKTVYLSKSYSNQITVKVTPINENINLFLTDVQNNYFTAAKNSIEELDVNYVVIESDS